MKVDKMNIEPKKRKKSLIGSAYEYVKNYAENCRYSFNKMLSI